MLKYYVLWRSLQWRPMVSFEIALSSKFFVYCQKKHRVVPYLQVTFLFLELKCDINQAVENILSLVLFSLHAVACSS